MLLCLNMPCFQDLFHPLIYFEQTLNDILQEIWGINQNSTAFTRIYSFEKYPKVVSENATALKKKFGAY
jgi:hypothetical protein